MKPILIDLFCGAGGATRGYQMAGFYVIGVDKHPQPSYCGDEFILDDAFVFLSKHRKDFDAIHASPPCQEYSNSRYLRNMTAKKFNKLPDIKEKLLEQTRKCLIESTLPWILENVATAPMPSAIVLCGTMFGLELIRHRAFESSILLFKPTNCRCRQLEGFYNAVGGHTIGYRKYGSQRKYKDSDGRLKDRGRSVRKKYLVEAMGIDWMTIKEMCQAIPPIYTKYLGTQLIQAIKNQEHP